MRALRSILGIKWQDKISNTEVLDRAHSSTIEAMLLKSQLRWTGHVVRMNDTRIPKQLFFGELKEGKRKRGRPRKRYKDNLKDNIKWCGIKPEELSITASNRQGWKTVSRQAVAALEESRRSQALAARERRHRAAASPARTTEFQCPVCHRLCKSNLGLYSHKRSHKDAAQ